MSQRTCCVPGCTVKSSDGVLLHRFPYPSNADKTKRFRQWVLNGKGDFNEDKEFIYRNKRICHKHFEDVYIYPSMKLSPLAIPTLHLPVPVEPKAIVYETNGEEPQLVSDLNIEQPNTSSQMDYTAPPKKDIHNTETQAARPATVILLQVDPNLSQESQIFPLHLLQNDVQYSQGQYLLPMLPNKQKSNQDQVQFQDQLQVLMSSQQKTSKTDSDVGAINQNSQKQYIPIANKTSNALEYVTHQKTAEIGLDVGASKQNSHKQCISITNIPSNTPRYVPYETTAKIVLDGGIINQDYQKLYIPITNIPSSTLGSICHKKNDKAVLDVGMINQDFQKEYIPISNIPLSTPVYVSHQKTAKIVLDGGAISQDFQKQYIPVTNITSSTPGSICHQKIAKTELGGGTNNQDIQKQYFPISNIVSSAPEYVSHQKTARILLDDGTINQDFKNQYISITNIPSSIPESICHQKIAKTGLGGGTINQDIQKQYLPISNIVSSAPGYISNQKTAGILLDDGAINQDFQKQYISITNIPSSIPESICHQKIAKTGLGGGTINQDIQKQYLPISNIVSSAPEYVSHQKTARILLDDGTISQDFQKQYIPITNIPSSIPESICHQKIAKTGLGGGTINQDIQKQYLPISNIVSSAPEYVSHQKTAKIVLDVDKIKQKLKKQDIPITNIPSSNPGFVLSNETLLYTSQSDLLNKQVIHESHKDGAIGKQNEKRKTIQNYVHISDRKVPPRAVAVLPTMLQIRARDVIYPRRTIPAYTRFGPVEGIKSNVSQSETCELILINTANKAPIFLSRDEFGHIVHIDVSDKDKSNWIGLLPLGDKTTANVWLYEESHELYAITTEPIVSRKALMLGYSKKYADDYGLVDQPIKEIKTEVPKDSKPWMCYECQRAMPSASMLQRHLDYYHKEENPIPRRRRYQCRNCSRTFCRLFTLRRHRLRHCKKKPEKSDNLPSTYTLPDIGLNTVPNAEDNRIPSDESFQNYSNGLDFSTNLFDTDRMPSLDISSNSRSEGEFNPYSIGYKDDNAVANDLGFTHPCSTGTEIPETCYTEKNPTHEQSDKQILFTCTYCNQVVVKEKKRQHIRACPARRFECECGKIFTNKKLLAAHIHTQHVNKVTSKMEQPTTSNDTQLKCDKCGHTFKRRGMLVNHLWRVHKAVCASVPLQRRVRHYPCVACPKIYRAAAKRDQHVALHHPGVDKLSAAQPIEGGVQQCEPAMCPACPKQYSTRAKMLQHKRACHPHLAPPPSKLPLKPNSDNASMRIVAEDLVKFMSSCHQMY